MIATMRDRGRLQRCPATAAMPSDNALPSTGSDLSQANAPAPRWFLVFLSLALAGYAAFLFQHYGAVAAGADSGGYYIEAKLMTEGRLSTPVRAVPELGAKEKFNIMPLGMAADEECTTLVPTYPPGVPLHYAVFGGIGGWKRGVRAFGVLIAVAALVLTYRLGRRLGVSPPFAAAAAAGIAVSPQFLHASLVPMSDTVATAWCCAAVLAALDGRGSLVRGVLAGAAFAMAVLVRPANAILLFPLLILLWSCRGLLGAFLGGLPGALFLGWFHWRLYGHPLRTGYGDVVAEQLFQLGVAVPTLRHYAEWMPRLLPLALGLVFAPLLPWRERPRELAALLAWALAFGIFYAFYFFTHTTWWFLRFVLPAFPALAVLGAWSCERAAGRFLPARFGGWRIALPAALVFAVSLAIGAPWTSEKKVLLIGAYQQPYRAASDWVEKHLPREALIATQLFSSAIFFYTENPILRWESMNPESWSKLRAGLAASGRPLYAVLLPSELQDGALSKHMPGAWTKVADALGAGIWKFDATRTQAWSQRPPRILLRSSWQSVNIGDVGHTPGVLQLLREHFPEARVTLWPADGDPEVHAFLRRHFPEVPLVRGSVGADGKPSAAVAAAFAEADFLLHGSGPSVVARKDLEAWRRITGKPYGIYGVTIDPVTALEGTTSEGGTLRQLAKAVVALPANHIDPGLRALLDGARFVTCRDSLSLEYLRAQKIACPVLEMAPDGAFGVKLADEARAEAYLAGHGLERGRFVCVVPRLRYTPYHLMRRREPTQRDLERAALSARHVEKDMAKVREMIVRLVRETGVKVLVCPEVTYQIDTGRDFVMARLPEDVRASVVLRDTFWMPDEACSVFARAAALVALDNHTPIFALTVGTPALYVRQPTDTIKGRMWQNLGVGDWFCEIDEIDGAALAERVREILRHPGHARGRVEGIMTWVRERQATSLQEIRNVP